MPLKINTNIENDVDGYLLDAKSVKGGYIVVSGIGQDKKENLPTTTVVRGTLVYDTNAKKSYRYTGATWEEETGSGSTDCGLTIVNGLICCSWEEALQIIDNLSYEYVDLDLPSGTLWAKSNIGTLTEYMTGRRFAFGDIYSSDEKEFTNQEYLESEAANITETDISETDYDMAMQIMGAGNEWRLPTAADMQELIDHTDIEDATITVGDNTYTGVKYISKTDSTKYIWVPKAGYKMNNTVTVSGAVAMLWTSLAITSTTARILYSASGSSRLDNYYKYLGIPVRGVKK